MVLGQHVKEYEKLYEAIDFGEVVRVRCWCMDVPNV